MLMLQQICFLHLSYFVFKFYSSLNSLFAKFDDKHSCSLAKLDFWHRQWGNAK